MMLRTFACAAVVAAFSAAAVAQSKFIPPPTTEAAPQVTPNGKPVPPPSQSNTPGTAMMTPQERERHRQDLERAKTGGECQAVAAKQRQQMAQRAKKRGEPAPPDPASDPCVGR